MNAYLKLILIWVIVGIIFSIPQIISYSKLHKKSEIETIKRRQVGPFYGLLGVIISRVINGTSAIIFWKYLLLVIIINVIAIAIDIKRNR